MKRFAVISLAAIVAVFAVDRIARAVTYYSTTSPSDGVARYVANVPQPPKVPLTCALPQGGIGCCVSYSPGDQTLDLSCDSATTCYYRFYSVADGGYPDAGGVLAVIGADNPLWSSTTRVLGGQSTLNEVCAASADGGTFNVAGTYP